MSETEMITFAHWSHNENGAPIQWVGLAQKKDGMWEIGLQTPYDEIATEFEEVCQGAIDDNDRRPYVLVDVSKPDSMEVEE